MENRKELWLAEERAAHIHGWDFSHIHGRYDEERDLPWDYAAIVRSCLRPDLRILDMDTGGGEFLLSLNHPHALTSATEAYPPNVRLCRETLLPQGIDFREADAGGPLPFPDGAFDLALNRHGNFWAESIARILKPGGRFITEQVGAENDRELVELLLPDLPPKPYPEQTLAIAAEKFRRAGLNILRGEEAFRPILFYDVGALVWFARIIEWEFPGFSVESCLPQLERAQRILEEKGRIEGRIHRFLIVAEKE